MTVGQTRRPTSGYKTAPTPLKVYGASGVEDAYTRCAAQGEKTLPGANLALQNQKLLTEQSVTLSGLWLMGSYTFRQATTRKQRPGPVEETVQVSDGSADAHRVTGPLARDLAFKLIEQ